MSAFILIADINILDSFSECKTFSLINKDDFLESSMYAQISNNKHHTTDQQDNLFEIGYEPMLSDNSMTLDEYETLRKRYVRFANSFNLYVGSLIEPYNRPYTDLDRRDKYTYVFYCK